MQPELLQVTVAAPLRQRSESSRVITETDVYVDKQLSIGSTSVQTPQSQFDPSIIRLCPVIGQYGIPKDWAWPYQNSFCPAQFGEINVAVSVLRVAWVVSVAFLMMLRFSQNKWKYLSDAP